MIGQPGSKVLVIIPTYNEAATIRPVVGRVRTSVPSCDVLVVDDGSPDGTGSIADELAGADRAVHVLHRPAKAGLGAAYMAGFSWAAERAYDVAVEMDADGSHQPEQLPRLLAALADADLALGARYVPGGEIVNWSRWRQALSRGGNVYTRAALGVPLRDATSGFRAFRMAALDVLGLDTVASHGYCFQIDLAVRAVRAGLRVTEVPITFVEREQGTSKMDGSIVAEALWRVTRWGGQHRLRQLRGALRKGR
jgi:dolichol-phosphate mannosyltransferase